MPAVIAENDVSQWADQTGVVYHFPKRYQALLTPGTQVIYYKGKLLDKAFADSRLSPSPHYFGVATIEQVHADEASSKGDLYAFLSDYRAFAEPVLAKEGDDYLEVIPDSKASNYWRSGVRPIDGATYQRIVNKARLKPFEVREAEPLPSLDEFESREEGHPSKVYSTRYERDPKLRQQAIAIHGLTCKGCGFNFEETYGEYAKGIIHIHHVVPLSEYQGSRVVDPEKDLVPLCPNCHSVVHRDKSNTLSLDFLTRLLRLKNSF